jgi:hypothetical protein
MHYLQGMQEHASSFGNTAALQINQLHSKVRVAFPWLKHRVKKRHFFEVTMTTMNHSQHYPDEDGDKPNFKSVAPETRFYIDLTSFMRMKALVKRASNALVNN